MFSNVMNVNNLKNSKEDLLLRLSSLIEAAEDLLQPASLDPVFTSADLKVGLEQFVANLKEYTSICLDDSDSTFEVPDTVEILEQNLKMFDSFVINGFTENDIKGCESLFTKFAKHVDELKNELEEILAEEKQNAAQGASLEIDTAQSDKTAKKMFSRRKNTPVSHFKKEQENLATQLGKVKKQVDKAIQACSTSDANAMRQGQKDALNTAIFILNEVLAGKISEGLSRQVQNIKDEMNGLLNWPEWLKPETSDLESLIKHHHNVLIKIQTEIQHFSDSFSSVLGNIDALEQEVELEKDSMVNLVHKLEDVYTEEFGDAAGLAVKNDRLKTELLLEQKELAKNETENTVLREQIKALEGALEQNESKVSSLVQTIESAKKEIEAERNISLKVGEELIKKNIQLQSREAELKAQQEKAKREIFQLNQTINNQYSELRQKKLEISDKDQLLKSSETLREQNKKLQDEVRKQKMMAQDIAEGDHKLIRSLKKENAELKKTGESLTDANRTQQNTVSRVSNGLMIAGGIGLAVATVAALPFVIPALAGFACAALALAAVAVAAAGAAMLISGIAVKLNSKVQDEKPVSAKNAFTLKETMQILSMKEPDFDPRFF